MGKEYRRGAAQRSKQPGRINGPFEGLWLVDLWGTKEISSRSSQLESLAIATRLADTRMFKVPVSSGGRLLGVEVWTWCLLLRQVAEGMGLSLERPRTSVGHFELNVLP